MDIKSASVYIREQGLLLLIIGVSCFLRFYGIASESFWLDELHTAIEADLSWKELFFYLKNVEQTPPVFFILEKLFFTVFGNTEFVARALSAIAGTIGVWMIYLLGKEFHSRKIGLVAATLTCFNYFHIYYSQEARSYALFFLFSGLSFLFLVRLIKIHSRKNTIQYCIYTLLMIYTHYFGLFVLVSQIIISLIFMICEKENKREFIKHFFLGGIIIAVGYSPWFSVLLSMKEIQSFWIQPIHPGFAIDFFYEYFGTSDLLKPFLILFLILALKQFFSSIKTQSESIKKDPYVLTFIVCFLWIIIGYLIPYYRSILIVPMLVSRYTIALLPAFIIFISFGIGLISNNIIKNILVVTFCILSLTDIFMIKDYYSKTHKSQFRELADYITSDTNNVYTIISKGTAWHQKYYLKKNGYLGKIIEGTFESQIDSILNNKTGKNHLKAFWLSDSHKNKKPKPELIKQLKSYFILTKEKDFYDAWAMLFVPRNENNFLTLNHHSFVSTSPFQLNGDTVVPIWEKEAISKPLNFKKGFYNVKVLQKGTAGYNIYPHVNIYINDLPIGNFYATSSFEFKNMRFNNLADTIGVVKIIMDNDTMSRVKKEDRNVFIKSIQFIKKSH